MDESILLHRKHREVNSEYSDFMPVIHLVFRKAAYVVPFYLLYTLLICHSI